MKLYVPACGDRIVLSKDWTFSLYNERRNWTLIEALCAERPGWQNYGKPFQDVTLPEGTTLEVDRIYIRTFNKSASSDENDFDSITFKIVGKKKQRFWAKLKDCNNIEFRSLEVETFKERKEREEEVAKTQPQRLDSNAIRDIAREASYGRGSFTQMFGELKLSFDIHIKESARLHVEAYDAYKAYIDNYNKTERDFPRRFYSFSPLRLDSFKELDVAELRRRVSTLDSPTCQFSKRPDGTNVRKFSWPWTDEVAHYWHYDISKFALQGIYVNVVTNADDTEIVSVNLCVTRMPKNVKKKSV
jgi:hypothetical protein